MGVCESQPERQGEHTLQDEALDQSTGVEPLDQAAHDARDAPGASTNTNAHLQSPACSTMGGLDWADDEQILQAVIHPRITPARAAELGDAQQAFEILFQLLALWKHHAISQLLEDWLAHATQHTQKAPAAESCETPPEHLSEAPAQLKSALRSPRSSHVKAKKPKGLAFNADSGMLTISAIRIFAAADSDGDGSLSLPELNTYIVAHPEKLSDVTEPGAAQWGDLMRLFEFDSNGDGQIQREEWVHYYVARSNELRCRAAADALQAQILANSATQMSPKSRRKKVVWPDELLGDRDSLEDVRVIENCKNDKPHAKAAIKIFEAADMNGDLSLTLAELNAYIIAHPEALADVTESGGSQWSVMMQLFGTVGANNVDGMISRSDWVHYYVARSNEIRLKKEADEVQDFFAGL